MDILGIIYVIDNTVNNMKYVGQTQRGVEHRWTKGHIHYANMQIKSGGTKFNKLGIHEAMRIYGIDKFSIRAIEENIPIDQMDVREKHWIKTLDTQTPNGYNITSGGGGFKPLGEIVDIIIDNMRTKELSKGLPKHVSFYNNNGYDCFHIYHHPLCTRKSFSIHTYGSVEAAREACLEFLKKIEESGIKYQPKRRTRCTHTGKFINQVVQ